MSQPPRPAQESAEGPPAHTAGQTEDVAAPPRSNRWASTERRTPALEDKSKFLGCGWGWGQGVYVEGREEHAQHFRFRRKTAAFVFSLISLLHAVSPDSMQLPLLGLSRTFHSPQGKREAFRAHRPHRMCSPPFCPCPGNPPRLSRSALCSACSEPGADTISLGLSHPSFNKKHRQRMNWQEGKKVGIVPAATHFLLPTSHHGPDYGTTAVVPFDGCVSGWFQVSDPSCPIKAQGQENFPSLLLLSAPPSPAHTPVDIPIMQCSSVTQSVELTSLELTSLAVHHLFSVGSLLRQIASTSSPLPTPVQPCWPLPAPHTHQSHFCLRAFVLVLPSAQKTLPSLKYSHELIVPSSPSDLSSNVTSHCAFPGHLM